MFSDRLYRMISMIFTMGCKLGSLEIEFDAKRLLVFQTKNHETIQTVKRNQLLVLFWIVIAVGSIVKDYIIYGTITTILIKFMVTIILIIVGLLYSIIHYFRGDFILFFNCTLTFYRYVHGKLYLTLKLNYSLCQLRINIKLSTFQKNTCQIINGIKTL